MASSTDFKNLWERYQKEGVPKSVSIVQYCQMNRIVYSQFECWYKNCRKVEIVPVELINKDATEPTGPGSNMPSASPPSVPSAKSKSVRNVEIVFHNGLTIRHRNLDYSSLKSLIEKLEVLC